jgi:type I restriction enzyme S subunit
MEVTATKATFQKYPAYTDSDTEWLGRIPTSWGLLSNKYVFKLKKNLVGKKSSDYVLLSLTLKGIIQRVLEDGGKFPAEFDTYQEVKKGDFVFCLFDVEETPRCVGLSDYEGMITGAYTVMEVNPNFDKRYLYYFYLNLDADKRMRPLYTGLRNTISKDNFFAFKTFVPPIPEQTAIANFLDDKTSKIDRAIAQKEQLIALLKERKQIIIQNAVTKGLDPDVKLKDSGVEWTGEIPDHWKVKKLKYVVKILKRIIGYEGPDVLSITQNGIKIKDITSGEGQLAMDYSKYQIVYKGEFAMNHMDLLTGYVDISKYDGVISPDYRVFAPFIDEVEDKYLLGLFQVGYKSKIFYRYGQGVSQLGRWRLPAENFNQFSIPIPPKGEQSKIMEHIEAKSAKIDQAISLQQTLIEKLKEYKATLIDSAVTGKIKVG